MTHLTNNTAALHYVAELLADLPVGLVAQLSHLCPLLVAVLDLPQGRILLLPLGPELFDDLLYLYLDRLFLA